MKFEKCKLKSCPGLLKIIKKKKNQTHSETTKRGNNYTKNAKSHMD